MKRLFTIIIILLFLALSGCTGQDVSNETGSLTFERTNPDLNGKMMDLELLPNDARAGENITVNLVVGNIGKENIVSETIEIKVKAMSLEDSLGNLALVAMSNAKKTMTFTVTFNEVIKPDTIKQLTHVFPTPRELKGRNLAGRYEVTVILSVNEQKVESKSIKLRLRSGKPRDSEGAQVNTISTTVTTTPASVTGSKTTPATTTTATPTPTLAPTPEPTEKAVTVEPTGNIYVTRIMGYKFAEPSLTINAGDTLQWYNLDDDTMTLMEIDGKIPNQSVYSRMNYNFTTTGIYHIKMFFPRMRVSPPEQFINVKLNQSN